MKEISRKINFPLVLAIVLHGLLLAALLVTFPSPAYRLEAAKMRQPEAPILVKSVSESALNTEIQAIKKARYQKKMEKIHRLQREHEKALAIKRARIQKEKRMAERRAQEKQKALKLAQEKKMRLEKKKILLAKQKKLQQTLLQQQMQQDKKALDKINTEYKNGQVNQYKAQILSEIQSHWRIQQVNAKINCVYEVDVAPGGMVLSAKLIKSSGDSVLDDSAKVAILKSSPLPVPEDPALFDQFRKLVLTLSPQGYV